ncbi:unnamed protein product [Paramecium pentaurelia]|uniref:Uncharacterized protein n=1 Tax=Paramecium pentaurelia TaxID=43138 RepID=A0A8S1YMD9_9CILI|nr:unnamed protein product [Paramecium pentaurelia]
MQEWINARKLDWKQVNIQKNECQTAQYGSYKDIKKIVGEINMMKKVIQRLENGLNFTRIFELMSGYQNGIFYLKITFWVGRLLS